MSKKATIGAVVYYANDYYKIVGIGDGKTYILEQLAKEPPCPVCGRGNKQVTILENSLTWQQEVVAVATIGYEPVP